jgi:SAM-dependent methyltransferase
MAMTQADIRAHYEVAWKSHASRADSVADLSYSSEVEDALLYPAYRQLLDDHSREPDGGSILDVGCGSGRWVGFFLQHYHPSKFVGIDFAEASIGLLRQWRESQASDGRVIEFRHGNIADPTLDLGEKFDLINIANVLFHIPEPELFASALVNLRKHLAPGGAIMTTEYLPRQTMRTNWMLVRSRYEFQRAVEEAGLRIAAVRATCFFANDPMGLDGPDDHSRAPFNRVRGRIAQLMNASTNPDTKKFLAELFVDVEQAAMAFTRERVAEIDFPSQKLVMLVAR